MNKDYKKLVFCNCGSHAICVAAYPELDDEIYIEWWATSGCEVDGWKSRIKAAWNMLRNGAYITHDVILYPEDADVLVDAIIEAANVTKKAEKEVTYDG